MLKIQTPNGENRVLLHSCCAPCSSAIIECMLANGIRPTVFYCNPNIYPQEEYEIRKQEAIRFVTSQNLDFIDADYDYTHWRNTMLGLEDEPERGGRCLKCFTLRLTETARCLYHYPRVFALEEPRPDKRSGKTGSRPLSRYNLLGAELAERRIARPPQPAPQRV